MSNSTNQRGLAILLDRRKATDNHSEREGHNLGVVTQDETIIWLHGYLAAVDGPDWWTK
ncbi:MAG: hypothetical protein KAW94_06265 [Candidatus Thorarchaeota archaeon]|nr:hypothetical protein [Candidatus Thorarchaeota archaeon]